MLKAQPRTGVLPGANLKESFIKPAKISSKLPLTMNIHCGLFISQTIYSQNDSFETRVTFLCLFQCQARPHFSESFKNSPFRFEQLCLFTVHGRCSANCRSMQFNCSGSVHQSPLFDCFFHHRVRGQNGHKTIKCILNCYRFMVPLNLPIKLKEPCSAFLPPLTLPSI